MKLFRLTAAALALAATASFSYADHHMGKNPMVGGKEMFPSKNIIEPSTRLTTRRSSQP